MTNIGSSSSPSLLPGAQSSLASMASVNTAGLVAATDTGSLLYTAFDSPGSRLPQQPPSLKFILTVWNSVVSPSDGISLQWRKDCGSYFFGKDLLDWLLVGGHCYSHENALNWAAVFLQHRCFAPAVPTAATSTAGSVSATAASLTASTLSDSSASTTHGLFGVGGIEFSDTMLYRVLRGYRPVQLASSSTLLSPSWLNDIAEPSTPTAAGAISAADSPEPSPRATPAPLETAPGAEPAGTEDEAPAEQQQVLDESDSVPDDGGKIRTESAVSDDGAASQLVDQRPPEAQTEALRQAYDDHLRDLVRQEASKLQVSLSWSDVICDLANRVAQQLPRNQNPLDSLRVKLASSGRKTDSFAFAGLVFAKNVLRKGMPTERGPGAAVLLLACSLEFERNENKLTCLEPQMMQETQYLRRCVDRIAEFKPQIVMIERSVALTAQEFLSDLGVSLFANVKPSVMHRVGQLCGAKILDSVDRLTDRSQLGCCGSMSVKMLSMGQGLLSRPCVFLSSIGPSAYQSVVLYGRRLAQLKRVKAAVITAVYCRYAVRMELAYALDCKLRPPQGMLMMLLDEDEERVNEEQEKDQLPEDNSQRDSSVNQSVVTMATDADVSTVSGPEDDARQSESVRLRAPAADSQASARSSAILRHHSVPVMDSSDPLQQQPADELYEAVVSLLDGE
uniref:1-phosphatidylinositol-3-phosphate 5-kinase n=1 Tax=Macrostomum lignano TaxID=282301 RepID=A0A1I8J8K7_9PLAT